MPLFLNHSPPHVLLQFPLLFISCRLIQIIVSQGTKLGNFAKINLFSSCVGGSSHDAYHHLFDLRFSSFDRSSVEQLESGSSLKIPSIVVSGSSAMLRLSSRKICTNINGGSKIMSLAQISSFHSSQISLAPRSFFGVEDFLNDDNSRPYTYQKEKKSKTPNKHISFKQRTVAYMEPFTLDVYISKRFVSASITHRVTCKQVAVAGTNSKDIKAALKSRSDIPACLSVGRILSDRAREADVYTASYTPRERDKFEGKIRAVVQSLIDNGIDVKIYLD